jgi:hypothetical protein
MNMRLSRPQQWLLVLALCTLSVSCGRGGDVAAPADSHTRASVNGGGQIGVWRAMDSGTTELLWGVSGAPTGEVIAVGTRGTAIHLAADVWQGKATGTARDLCDVWGAADGRAISVGTGGTILGYDASQWDAMTSGTEDGLYDAWGFETFEAVAVGDTGTILRFDGTGWSPMTSGTSVSLFGVWGDAPSSLFAVGVGGTILHFDGALWGFMTTPTPHNLSAVWGTGADNVWAVGDAGTVIHYDGAQWGPVSSGVGANLYDVWGSAANDAWIAGENGTILHYDGSAWSPVESGTTEDLFGVWGRSATEAYAVGANGTVLRFGPEEEDGSMVFVCHDHPDGAAAPPTYGLRLDSLLGDGSWTFSFDYADATESARVILTYDEARGRIRIFGRAYGGRVDGHEWSAASRGWIDLDFTYTTNLVVKDDCGALAGDDLYIIGESVANRGVIGLDGWGGDLSLECSDRSGEGGACSFIFDNDTDPKGNAAIADDLSIWSGSGWIVPEAEGTRDWLFIAREEPASD